MENLVSRLALPRLRAGFCVLALLFAAVLPASANNLFSDVNFARQSDVRVVRDAVLEGAVYCRWELSSETPGRLRFQYRRSGVQADVTVKYGPGRLRFESVYPNPSNGGRAGKVINRLHREIVHRIAVAATRAPEGGR